MKMTLVMPTRFSQKNMRFNGNIHPNLMVLARFSSDSGMTTKEKVISEFFNSFVNKMEVIQSQSLSKSKSNIGNYQDKVFELLHSNKDNQFQDLNKLQMKIEGETTQFDDLQTIYHLAPEIINKLISKDQESALDFIRKKNITDNDMELLSYIRHHTLEAIMVYVLGSLFHNLQDSPAVRVSTMVDYLNNYVKTHGTILKSRKHGSQKPIKSPNPTDSTKKDAKIRNEYLIGTLLVEFLVSRELITLTNDLEMSSTTTIFPNKNKKGQYFYPKSLYAICNFNINLLPVKLNLPMVCEPEDWCEVDDVSEAKTLTDLYGGYLSKPIGDFYIQRYRLLTSRDYEHFNITLGYDYKKLCEAMNFLQKQAFTINEDMLNFINNNYEILVKLGLLMPRILASLNIAKSIELLRVFYLADESVMKVISFKDMLQIFMTRVQSARFEVFILNLASAYSGYTIYLPAFLDFRGRIYRSGILHFHERDLARSLLVYANPTQKLSEVENSDLQDSYLRLLMSATAFHYKKLRSYNEAIEWYNENYVDFYHKEKVIQLSVYASNPFQFISKVISRYEGGKIDPLQLPITQDASASAYQMMAYFLLDHEMAKKTNLIPSVDDDSISDIYIFFLEELTVDLQNKYDDSLCDIICSRLTRKLVKKLFMPIIYGKTVMSMANDINQHYSSLLNQRECLILASHISKFFIQRFPGISNLMALVRSVSWLTSVMDKPIIYDTPLLTTIQDYMKSDIAPLWVYDRIQKKRRQVTLRIPTPTRDRRKTHLATFANFIHQKDANIAMFMIINLMLEKMNVPIYTVHDNFITTIPNAKFISDSYINVICNGRDPLLTIKNFIIQNLDDNTINLHKTTYLYDLNAPLPTSYLSDILIKCVPSSLNEKQKEKINKSIIDSYENYVNTVSKVNDDNLYNLKLNEFKDQMYRWMNLDYNYSLHL